MVDTGAGTWGALNRPFVDWASRARWSSLRSERDGILGNELLRHFRVTFDYSRRVLVLEK